MSFTPQHIARIEDARAKDQALQQIIEQRALVAIAREDVVSRPGAYNLSLILQQEKEKLARLLETRWAKFGIVG
jgi:hypothetical protein